MGKPSSGLLAGARVIWLGSYSECTRMIEGSHYCLVITELQGSPPVPKPVMHFLVSSIAIFSNLTRLGLCPNVFRRVNG